MSIKNKQNDTIIYFIRHSHVDYKNFDFKGVNIDLSPQGWEKTIELADKWNIANIESIYTSPLNRCVETIFPLSRKLKIPYIIKDGFKELDYKGDAEVFHKNILTDINFAYPQGETIREANKRFEDQLKKVLDNNNQNKIIISTHGTVLSEFIINHFKFEKDFFFELTYPDVIEVKYKKDTGLFKYIKKHNIIKYERDYRVK